MPVEMNAAPMARTPVTTAGIPRDAMPTRPPLATVAAAPTARAETAVSAICARAPARAPTTRSAPPRRYVNAKPAANVAMRMVISAPAVATMALVTTGCACASSVTLPIHGLIVFRTLLNAGSSTLPIVIPSAVIWFRNITSSFAVVAARAWYSFSIEPAYFILSATASNFFSSSLMLVSNGAIEPTTSLPKSCVRTADCSCFRSFATCLRMTSMVFLESSCMDFATAVEE